MKQHQDRHDTGFGQEQLTRWVYYVNGFLHALREMLLPESASLRDLLEYIQDEELYPTLHPGQVPFDEDDIHLLQSYEAENKVRGPHFNMPPAAVASLLHWRILGSLIKKLTPEQRKEIMDLEKYTTYEGSPILRLDIRPPTAAILPFADSHFHLDSLLHKEGCSNFHELEQTLHSPGMLLQFGVANCVFPSNWWKMKVLMDKQLEEGIDTSTLQRVEYTFGVHPHFTGSPFSWGHLKQLIRHPLCVGVGEVGIDHTTFCKTCRPACTTPTECAARMKATQLRFLKDLLPLVKGFGKTLVLHCRDKDTGEAAQQMLDLLHEYDLSQWPIHRHCYTGSAQELSTWSQQLPQCHFGFTTTIRKALTDKVLGRVITRLPRDRFLLETDSPYLPPDRRQPLNTPWRIDTQAGILASLRNRPLDHILSLTLDNARDLYSKTY
jgi:TatD DNase family protein